MDNGMGQDVEWDDEFRSFGTRKVDIIADNKWFQLLMLPVKFVLFCVMIVLGILVCSLVLSPIFVCMKFGMSFVDECADVWEAFRWNKGEE